MSSSKGSSSIPGVSLSPVSIVRERGMIVRYPFAVMGFILAICAALYDVELRFPSLPDCNLGRNEP